MPLIVVFLLLGAAAASLEVFAAPIRRVVSHVHDAGERFVFDVAAGTGAPEELVLLLAALTSVTLPGLVCLLLVETLRATGSLRRAGAVTLVALAGCSYLVLPAGGATVLVFAAVVFAALFLLASAVVVLAPTAAAVGYLCGTYVLGVVGGLNPTIDHHAKTLNEVLSLGSWWTVLLATFALIPMAGCLLRLFASPPRADATEAAGLA